MKRLGDVCNVTRGTSITRKTAIPGPVPVVAGGLEPAYYHNMPNRPANVITVSGSGANAGFVNYWEIPIYASDCSTIIPQNGNLDSRYLYFAMLNLQDYINEELRCGAAQPHVYPRDLAELKIPVPPPPEQRRIVAILDKAFAAISSIQAAVNLSLEKTNNCFLVKLETTFRTATNWKVSELGAIGAIQTGNTPKTSIQTYYGNDLPFVKPADFNSDGSITYKEDGLSKEGAKVSRVLLPHSVLMVCIGATIGKVGITECRVATNQQINAWTPSPGFDSRFFYYQMLTKSFQARVRANAGQATLPIINKSKWSKLEVSYPVGRQEQEAIALALSQMELEIARLQRSYRTKLTALEELKKSLLHQAFTGKL